MSWARGIRDDGKEAGYDIDDVCGHPECQEEIDRGISFTCGGVEYLHSGYGCGEWFCPNHLEFGTHGFLCYTCIQAEEDIEDWLHEEDQFGEEE